MKKIILMTLILLLVMSGVAFAVTPEEFIELKPNPYIYKIEFPNGRRLYVSSPDEFEFRMSEKFTIVNEKGLSYTYMWEDSGMMNNIRDTIKTFSKNEIGVGKVNIYRWDGNNFFLLEHYQRMKELGELTRTILPVGLTRTILPVGFGILSVTLSLKLLTGYFRRYLHRLS